MSALPSRTRSLGKRAERTEYERPAAEGSIEDNTVLRPTGVKRSSQSPSRLPVKPQTRSTTTATSSARPVSFSGSSTSNASKRPPLSRANISKPTTSGLHKFSTTQNPTKSAEPAKDRSTIHKPEAPSRHIRNASASTVPANPRGPGHSRTKSSSTLLSSSTVLLPPAQTSPDYVTSQAPQPVSQLKRPAFSILQQHYSPAKSLGPKPHPATFLAPPSPSKLPSNVAISAETAKLQNELLQLHLFHRDVARVEKEWRASAKRKLGSTFQSVVQKNEQLVRLEDEETGKINAAALKKWQELGAPGCGLEEKTQILDEVLTGLWNLGESRSKYARAIRKFEKWVIQYQDILDARESDNGLEDEELVFVEGMDGGWKDDCLVLTRKLETWKNQLKNLGSPDNGSSLAAVVEGCRSLVHGMLMELNLMSQIEQDAMGMETEWIRAMNNDTVEDDKDTPVAGAVWRMY